VKPPAFLYVRPDSLDEALAALAEHGEDAKALAGGQSLVPMLNFRLANPGVLVDLSRVPELVGVSRIKGALSVGAMTRQRTAERSEEVRAGCPLVSVMLPFVGHLQNRNRGTVGGSIAHADPAAELPALCLALGGTFILQRRGEERRVAAERFFKGPFMTCLAGDELLTTIELPCVARSDVAFAEIARRHGDFAMAGVVAVRPSGADGEIRLVAFGVGSTPVRLPQAEALVESAGALTRAVAIEASAAAAAEIDPVSDLHADAATRRAFVSSLARRVLSELGDG
jgi:aerobic carbon-monoxide dehydrogenase medium subunit